MLVDAYFVDLRQPEHAIIVDTASSWEDVVETHITCPSLFYDHQSMIKAVESTCYGKIMPTVDACGALGIILMVS